MTTYLSAPANGTHPGTLLVENAKTSSMLTNQMMQATAETFRDQNPWPDWKAEVVVPCPSTSAPIFPRALLMAQAVGSVLQTPAHDILVKAPGAVKRSNQTSKPYPPNFQQLCQEGSAKCVGKLMGEESVLLVDDLMTQGATAASSALALRQAGARDVRLITFAQYTTPGHLEGYCD